MVLIPFLSVLFGGQDPGQQITLQTPPPADIRGRLTRNGIPSGTAFYVYSKPMAEPKYSPQKFGKPPKPFEFAWHTDGYTPSPRGADSQVLRFRVFAQTTAPDGGMATAVARQLLRMWELDHARLGIDHREDINRGVVDVYLCQGGDPGGEQLFDTDTEAGFTRKANTIYIYDVKNFTDKMEQAREVAHEYGHAVLPPVGGFTEPENWADGYLGEKLYLRWLRDEMAAGNLSEPDAMGVTSVTLDYWVKLHVDPLVRAAAQRKPSSPLMSGKGAPSMAAFEGLALYCDSIMPPKMFGRSLQLIGSTSAKDYVGSCVMAAEEATYHAKIPAYLYGAAVWVPVGSGHVSGDKVLATDHGWALVRPKGHDVTVISSRAPAE